MTFQYAGSVYALDWNPVGTHIAFGGSRNDGQDATTQIEFVGLTESFSLLASDNTVIANSLANGAEFELSTLPASVKFRSNTNPETVGSVKFELTGSATASFTANTTPYELNWTPVVGSYTLTATPYSGTGGTGTPGTPLTINFDVISSAAISSVSLVDPSTSEGVDDFDPLENNDVIDLATMIISPVHIIAAPNVSTVGSVKFVLDSGTPYNVNTEPYQLENWVPTVGPHTMTVTPYSGANGTGTPGTALTINFTVINSLNRILYANAGNGHLYIMNPDATNPVDLGAGYDPAWSPDGSRLAYTAPTGNGREIWVMNTDGSNQVRLTTNSADDRHPAWSPDGSQIAWASVVTNSDWEIWVMNADGSNKHAITNNAYDDNYPAWSPNGNLIAFSYRDGCCSDYDIYTMQSNGNQRTRLLDNDYNDTDPNWSHDGTMIVWTRDAGTNTDIYRMNGNGSNVLRLTNDAAVDQNASWTADGNQIVFSSQRSPGTFNYFELYTMNTDGSAETRLTATNSINETQSAWGYP